MTEGNGDEGAGTAAPAEGAQALEERVAALVAEQTEGLRRKNSELLGEVKKLKGRSKDLPEDFDPEQWKALKDAEAHRVEEEARRAGQWDKLKNDLVSRHEAQRGELQTALQQRTGQLHDYIVRNEALSAIAKADGITELLLPHVRGRLKLHEEDGKFSVQVVDSDGNPRIGSGKGEPMTLDQLLTEMKETEVFAPAFRGSRATGGGANGSGRGSGGAVKNPWKKETFNLTEQGRLIRENPDLAQRLRAEANA